MWANYHMHSAYCDGVGNLSDYLDQAAASGVHYAGFSSHAPVPFNCKWCMRKEYLPTYLSNIESLKPLYPNIQLYKGLEIDFAPGMISPADFRDQLDYTIGSIHFIGNLADGRPWEIDGPHELFLQGLQSIFNNNIRLAITSYYELTREMITTSRPDIIGHLDKIKIQNPGEKFFRETDEWYQDEIIRTLDEIARTGSVVEVNTRGIYQKKSTTTYPSPWVLELIHKRNIPVTLSSDAHKPLDIINQFSETARLLIAIGFKKISILKDKTWQPVILTENGIIP